MKENNRPRLSAEDQQMVREIVTRMIEMLAEDTAAAPEHLKNNIVASVALSALSTLHHDRQFTKLSHIRKAIDGFLSSPDRRPDLGSNVEHGGYTTGRGDTGKIN